MSETKVYPVGIRMFNKHEKAPDFIIGTMVISIDSLVSFCQDNPHLLTKYKDEDQLKIQIQQGKKGLTAVVDTWRKEVEKTVQPESDQSLPF